MNKFSSGDRVNWHDECSESMVKEIGSGPFIIRGVEDEELGANGHCQWLSLQKEIDGKLFAWVSYKNAWVEDEPGPPYMAAPPTFSNLSFKKI